MGSILHPNHGNYRTTEGRTWRSESLLGCHTWTSEDIELLHVGFTSIRPSWLTPVRWQRQGEPQLQAPHLFVTCLGACALLPLMCKQPSPTLSKSFPSFPMFYGNCQRWEGTQRVGAGRQPALNLSDGTAMGK